MRHSRILCCPRQPSTFSVYPQIKERRLSSSITFLPVTCRRKTVEHMIWDLETFQFCFRREDVQTEPFYDDNSNREKNLPGWPSEKVNKPAFLPACPLLAYYFPSEHLLCNALTSSSYLLRSYNPGYVSKAAETTINPIHNENMAIQSQERERESRTARKPYHSTARLNSNGNHAQRENPIALQLD